MDDYSELTDLLSNISGAALVILGIILFAILAILIFTIIAYIFLFKKCNKPGWASIVPFYSIWVECEIVGCHWIIFAIAVASSILGNYIENLSFILSLLSLFANIVIMINLAKKFHKETGFIVGLILLPVVFIPILAFSKNCVYDANTEVKNCGFFDVNF